MEGRKEGVREERIGLDWSMAIQYRRYLTPHVWTAGAVDAGARPVTLGRGLLRLCGGPLPALLLLLLLLCLDVCDDPAGAPRRVCLRCCGSQLEGSYPRGLAPDGDTRAPQGGTCWGLRAGFVLVVGWCFVVVVRLICRAQGVVPGQGLGDPSGLAYTRLLGGPTGGGRKGGMQGGGASERASD